MTQTQKFLFETSFDADLMSPPWQEAAEMPGQKPAQADEEPAPPCFTETDLAEAERRGLAEGRDQGLEEARQGTEQAIAQATAAIQARLETCAADIAEVNERRERQSFEAAAAILRKLFPEMERRHALDEVLAVVESCLARLHDEPRLVIRTANDLHDQLRERIDPLAKNCGFEGKVVLLGDDALAPSDVRIEWADGGTERDTTRLWAEIDSVLSTAFGATAARSEDSTIAEDEADQAPMAPPADSPPEVEDDETMETVA